MKLKVFIASLGLVALGSTGFAQEDGPQLLDLRVVTVKPSRAAEWESLQIQFNEAREAAGQPGRDFWQVFTGNLDTYYIVTPIEQRGPAPFPTEGFNAAAWGARINDTLVSRSNMVLVAEAEIPVRDDVDYTLAVVRTRNVEGGRNGEYRAFVNERWIPAFAERGVSARFVTRVLNGGDPGTWYSVQLHEDWDSINGPGVFAGEADDRRVQQLFADLNELAEQTNVEVLVYRADLSN